MEKIAIVILNWNGRKHLETFLPSVSRYSEGAAIYVADNNSTDTSIEFIKENYPSIKLLQFTSNNGFCKGYNDALFQIEAEYYVLLNSDVEVTEHWLEPMLSLMESDESIAACQPKILDWKNREYFEYAGAAGGFVDKLGYPFCRGRIFLNLEKDLGQYNDIREIFWATGASLFVRARCYKELGGLDEDFFAHMEEIDICWRMKLAGYKIMYCGQSTVYHVGAATLSKSSPRKTYLNFRNSLFVIYKNLPAHKLFTTILIRLILDGIAGIKFMFSDSYKHVLAILHAHYSFYKNIPTLQKKRREFGNENKKIIFSELYLGSIVFDYFIKGRVKFRAFNFKDPK
ncbi:MAG: glycosyltransferase family 2 protein [Cytophagaceae bacterium]